MRQIDPRVLELKREEAKRRTYRIQSVTESSTPRPSVMEVIEERLLLHGKYSNTCIVDILADLILDSDELKWKKNPIYYQAIVDEFLDQLYHLTGHI